MVRDLTCDSVGNVRGCVRYGIERVRHLRVTLHHANDRVEGVRVV